MSKAPRKHMSKEGLRDCFAQSVETCRAEQMDGEPAQHFDNTPEGIAAGEKAYAEYMESKTGSNEMLSKNSEKDRRYHEAHPDNADVIEAKEKNRERVRKHREKPATENELQAVQHWQEVSDQKAKRDIIKRYVGQNRYNETVNKVLGSGNQVNSVKADTMTALDTALDAYENYQRNGNFNDSYLRKSVIDNVKWKVDRLPDKMDDEINAVLIHSEIIHRAGLTISTTHGMRRSSLQNEDETLFAKQRKMNKAYEDFNKVNASINPFGKRARVEAAEKEFIESAREYVEQQKKVHELYWPTVGIDYNRIGNELK